MTCEVTTSGVPHHVSAEYEAWGQGAVVDAQDPGKKCRPHCGAAGGTRTSLISG